MEQAMTLSDSDPHRFPPFYGNRSDFHNKYDEKDFPRWNMVNDLVVYRERIYSESILQELPSERSRLSKCFGLDNNNPPICKVLFAQNGTGQYPVWITQKPRKTDLIKGVKIQKISGPGANFRLGESSAKRNFASLDVKFRH